MEKISIEYISFSLQAKPFNLGLIRQDPHSQSHSLGLFKCFVLNFSNFGIRVGHETKIGLYASDLMCIAQKH